MRFPTAGSRSFIGPARPDWMGGVANAANFSGTVWTEIAHLTDLGRLGGEWVMDDQSSMMDDPLVAIEGKGKRGPVDIEMIADLDLADSGQLAVIAAEAGEDCYPFRLLFPDSSSRMFFAFVIGLSENYEDANTQTSLGFKLRLQSTTVRAT